MVKRAQAIVVGFDGSDGAKRALDRAADLVGYGTRLSVVHVVPPSAHANGSRLLDEARRRLNGRQVAAHTLERVGDPTAELIRASRELRAHLLVIGDGKRSTEGSVGARLIREAPCDVLVVR
jgi:nucleotide-binding universal stress UspA family protein